MDFAVYCGSKYVHVCSIRTEFGQNVAREYLKFFEFERMSLDEGLRQFLSCFMLTGESQERERIMAHFSDRYFMANPDLFPNAGIYTTLHTQEPHFNISRGKFSLG